MIIVKLFYNAKTLVFLHIYYCQLILYVYVRISFITLRCFPTLVFAFYTSDVKILSGKKIKCLQPTITTCGCNTGAGCRVGKMQMKTPQ